MSHTFTKTNAHDITCTRRFQFCAGHRVYGHESKCAHLHGHNYVVLVTARPVGNMLRSTESTALDSLGRVIDFSVIKRLLGEWIDQKWDHGFILFAEDNQMRQLMSRLPIDQSVVGGVLPIQKLYLMQSNPTAENMAQHLLVDICPMLFTPLGIEICKVRVWETENCYADASLADQVNES